MGVGEESRKKKLLWEGLRQQGASESSGFKKANCPESGE